MRADLVTAQFKMSTFLLYADNSALDALHAATDHRANVIIPW